MARKLRVEYPGAIYHLINRGDRRGLIFRDAQDRQRFLQTLAEACQKTDWQVHAYCLMSNHFHFVVETPKANLVAGMKWFLGTYTGRFNRRHKVVGHLFSGRYKSLVVDGSGGGYLWTVCEYVHLNPVRAKLLETEQPLRAYRWSSYPLYLQPAGQRPVWLRVDRVLGENGIAKDSAAGRREFERRMEARRREDAGEQWTKIRRGWCLGDEDFRKELLEQMGRQAREWHRGEEIQEAAEEKANRILREELKRLGWKPQELGRRRKGDPQKVRIAQRLRRETTMTLPWIAERLEMGTRTYLTHLLYWSQRERG